MFFGIGARHPLHRWMLWKIWTCYLEAIPTSANLAVSVTWAPTREFFLASNTGIWENQDSKSPILFLVSFLILLLLKTGDLRKILDSTTAQHSGFINCYWKLEFFKCNIRGKELNIFHRVFEYCKVASVGFHLKCYRYSILIFFAVKSNYKQILSSMGLGFFHPKLRPFPYMLFSDSLFW